jgi:hypothetical protein
VKVSRPVCVKIEEVEDGTALRIYRGKVISQYVTRIQRRLEF